MIQKESLRGYVAYDGPDFVNKTRFALITAELVRRFGQKCIYLPLPFLWSSVSGKILQLDKGDFAREALHAVFIANRLEVLPILRDWLSLGVDYWAIGDRADIVNPVYAAASGLGFTQTQIYNLERLYPNPQLGILLMKSSRESKEIARRRPRSSVVSKKRFDDDWKLQAEVRRGFREIVRDNPYWMTVRVPGVADPGEPFRQWEIATMSRIWYQVTARIDQKHWRRGADKHIEEIRDGIPDNPREVIMKEVHPIRAELIRRSWGGRTRGRIASPLFD